VKPLPARNMASSLFAAARSAPRLGRGCNGSFARSCLLPRLGFPSAWQSAPSVARIASSSSSAVAEVRAGSETSETVAVQGAKRSHRLALYWKLAKGKLTVWVSLSALPGYFLAVPGALDPVVLAALFTGTFLTSSSAQTMNQIYEVKRDALMHRTMNRPLPTGQISRLEGIGFASATGVVGLGILSVGATPATAMVAAATMATYAAAYTPMKVLTPYNTHVGAISGSLPTVMGFTAALGTGIVASPWAAHAAWLFVMQMLWQMPHFYALAWLHRADYLRGGYDMFPLTDTTGHATAAMSKPYLVALCALPWGMSAFGAASWMLPVGAVVPSALWWHSLRKFEDKPSPATCRRFFLGSLSYLLSMLALFTVYARVDPTPACQVRGTSSEEDGSLTCPAGEGQVAVVPVWRAKMLSMLNEACPHALVSRELLGAGKQGCPLSRDPPL